MIGDESDAAALARAYYDAIDRGEYDALGDLLAPDFRQVRADRTIAGREAFVSFMRDERPETDTTHVVDGVYDRADADTDRAVFDPHADDEEAEHGEEDTSDPADEVDGDVIAVGRLHRADGSLWFRFADVFAVDDGRLAALATYTR